MNVSSAALVLLAFAVAAPVRATPLSPPADSAMCKAAEVVGREATKVFTNARLSSAAVTTTSPALASDWKGKAPPAALIARTRTGFTSNVVVCANAANLVGTSGGEPQGDAKVEASLPVLSADERSAISLLRMRAGPGSVSAWIYLEKRGAVWQRVGTRLAAFS